MRIGKILVDSDPETHEARVIFAKFPSDIAQRKVLLLYPIMSSGNKVCRAMQVLKDHKVPENHVILINLFSTPQAAQRIVREVPNLTVLTTEVHDVSEKHPTRLLAMIQYEDDAVPIHIPTQFDWQASTEY